MRTTKSPRSFRPTILALVALLSLLATTGTITPAQADPPQQETVQIDTFTCYRLFNDIWVFEGQISGGPTLNDLPVEFGGLLEGHSTTTNIDGSIYYEVDLGGQNGTVSCVVTSIDSIRSEKALTEAG